MNSYVYGIVGEAIVTFPACILLAFVGVALTLRRHRLYSLLIVAAVLWAAQAVLNCAINGVFAYVMMGNVTVPNEFFTWAPVLRQTGTSALQTLSWIAIAVAMLWPRRTVDLDADVALAEDAIA